MLNQKLTIKAAHTLVMTKQLQQSFKILQMHSIELKQYLEEQIEENPFIEVPDNLPVLSEPEPQDIRYESVQPRKTEARYDGDYISNLVNETITLKEHLLNQIAIEINAAKERMIALRCTDALDENGYLREDVSEISKALKCNIPDIEGVLNKLYKLDPSGAYARNLQECLALQLKDQNIFDDTLKILLENLDLLAKGELAKLAKYCKISIEELKGKIGIIKKLNPKPGRNFFSETVQTLIPDAYITFDADANLSVKLNENYLPNINLNNELYKDSLETLKNKAELEFCKTRYHNAMFVARALAQRAETIFLITAAIANEQYEFFEKGVNFLKPITLSDIAKKTNLHESTISRVSNKVIATPIGTFEIKYFFTSKIKSNFTENIYSSTSIKQKIKDMIENETTSGVLADDKISVILQSKGIDISRRTVTKYREAMRIPSSHERKRLKAMVC